MKLQRKRLALTTALLFFAVHPLIHFRPLYPYYEAALIAFHFPNERWYVHKASQLRPHGED